MPLSLIEYYYGHVSWYILEMSMSHVARCHHVNCSTDGIIMIKSTNVFRVKHH